MAFETKNFVDAVAKSELPFIYYGDKLNDAKCQKVLKKIKHEGNLLCVFICEALMGNDGMAITDKGVYFALFSGGMGQLKTPKLKGSFPFDKFIIHSVSVQKAVLPKFDIEWVIWDIEKKKSDTFYFAFPEDASIINDSSVDELENIFKTLVSTTGTEFVPKQTIETTGESGDKTNIEDPNKFSFVWGVLSNIHTIITVDDEKLVIEKLKVDNKTNIQTPKGSAITINRAALDSIKLKRSFSPSALLGAVCAGALIGFILIGGIITLLLFAIVGFILSFPKTMFINRKDGTKYKTVIKGDESEYERLINTIFK